jgi:hypothetical protein
MTISGLYIICSPGGYYPYVRVAWCDRMDGMIRMRGCRVIKRFGTNAELAKIAQDGPASNAQLLSAAEVEYTSVGLVSRMIPCNPKAWAKACPRPEEVAAGMPG